MRFYLNIFSFLDCPVVTSIIRKTYVSNSILIILHSACLSDCLTAFWCIIILYHTYIRIALCQFILMIDTTFRSHCYIIHHHSTPLSITAAHTYALRNVMCIKSNHIKFNLMAYHTKTNNHKQQTQHNKLPVSFRHSMHHTFSAVMNLPDS